MAQTPSYYDRGGRPTKRDRRRFEQDREARRDTDRDRGV
jgi:ribosome-associated heat shock protein Hsp15